MTRTLAAVNLHYKRQTGSIKNYTFGVYFNVVAANMTVEGGWIPCAPFLNRARKKVLTLLSRFYSQKQVDDQVTLLNRQYIRTGVGFHLLGVTRIISRYWHETVEAGLSVS